MPTSLVHPHCQLPNPWLCIQVKLKNVKIGDQAQHLRCLTCLLLNHVKSCESFSVARSCLLFVGSLFLTSLMQLWCHYLPLYQTQQVCNSIMFHVHSIGQDSSNLS